MDLEVILVAFDVDSVDTPVAHAPRQLIERGLLTHLEELGRTVRLREVGVREFEDREMTVASLARATSRLVARATSRGRRALILSGGCLAAVGVVHGLQGSGHDLGALWLDAHGDFNTPETTPSGYWDGMALAAVAGRSLSGVYVKMEYLPLPLRKIVHLGGRDFDPEELEDFKRLRVTLLEPAAVSSEERCAELVERLSRCRDLYLHLDLDGLDPADAPAVSLPVAGGVELGPFLALLERLPEPVAVTLSGMNLESASESEAARQLETCLRLVKAAFRL